MNNNNVFFYSASTRCRVRKHLEMPTYFVWFHLFTGLHCIHTEGLWMFEINIFYFLFIFRWTTSWSPGPAPHGLITLPRSRGNWVAGPASVSRRRRKLASRQTEAAQPPVCLPVSLFLSVCRSVFICTDRCVNEAWQSHTDSIMLNRSGGWLESQSQRRMREREWRAENGPEISADAEIYAVISASAHWDGRL